jgi:hypothetical protein
MRKQDASKRWQRFSRPAASGCWDSKPRGEAMKTLARQADKAEIVQRLRQVREDSVRRWGRMSAPQMICHLSDSFRVVIGRMSASPATGLLQRTLMKWIALHLPLRWPVGITTRPELDQVLGGGTTPGNFATDVAELEALVELITTQTRSLDWQPHPIFGRMSEADWMRWAYLHMDHHLRQFGL